MVRSWKQEAKVRYKIRFYAVRRVWMHAHGRRRPEERGGGILCVAGQSE